MHRITHRLRREAATFALFVLLVSAGTAIPLATQAFFPSLNMASAASGWRSFVCGLPEFLLFSVPEYCTEDEEVTIPVAPVVIDRQGDNAVNAPVADTKIIPSVSTPPPQPEHTPPALNQSYPASSADYLLSLISELRSELEAFKTKSSIQTDRVFTSIGNSVDDLDTSSISGLGTLATASSVNDSNWSGTDLAISNGGTGTSTAPAYGEVLLGNALGGYDLVATSSLGITSGSGSGTVNSGTINQLAYYASSGTAVSGISTSSLGLLTTNVSEGSNLYYTDARVNSYINASTTIPKLYTANTFTGLQTFTNASTTNLTVTSSSYLGTIASGAWNGTEIGIAYGGTGTSTLTGARNNLQLAEPVKGLGFFNKVVTESTRPVKIGTFGDGFAYILSLYLNTQLSAVFGFAGYELGSPLKLSAGASSVSNAWTYWTSGLYYSIPAGETGTFATDAVNPTRVLADTIKVYYIKESGAGTIKLQTSTDNSTWTDMSSPCSSIDASDASTVGGVTSCSVTLNQYYVRVVGVSGTVKVLGIAIYASSNATIKNNGYIEIGQRAFSKDSGTDWTELNSVSTDIFNPIVASIAPDLLIMMTAQAATITDVDTFNTKFQNAFSSTSWIYLGSNINYTDPSYTGNESGAHTGALLESNNIIRERANYYGHAFLDLYNIWGTLAQATSSLMVESSLPPVHPTAAGFKNIITHILSDTSIGQSANLTKNFKQVATDNGYPNQSSAGIYQYGNGNTSFNIQSPANYSSQLIFSDLNSQGNKGLITAYSTTHASYAGWMLWGNTLYGNMLGCGQGVCKIGKFDAKQTSATLEVNSMATAVTSLWVNGYYTGGQTANLLDITSSGTSPSTNRVFSVSAMGSVVAAGNLTVSTTTVASSFYNASTTNVSVLNNLYLPSGIWNSSGNLGIGTTSPWRALSVNGSSDLGINALAGYFTATSTTVASTFAKDIQISNTSDPSLLITKSGQSSFNISATGSNGGAKFTSTSGNAAFRPISFETNAGTASLSRLFISGLGLIGINDTTPSHILDISLPAESTVRTTAFSGIKVSNTATSTTDSIIKSGMEIVSTGSWTGTSASNIGLYVSSVTGGTNNYDAIFNGGGNVGIGTTSPWRKLSVTGTASFSGLTSASTNNGAGSVCLSANNELVYNSGSDACLPSLRETKHDITKLSLDATSVINGLDPVSFIYNSGDQRTRYGFIAEDTMAIDAHLVTYDAEGEVSGIDDRAVLSLLVKVVKEMIVKINSILAWFVGDTLNIQNDVCVDDICVTKEQFKALLMDAGAKSREVKSEDNQDSNGEESDNTDILDQNDQSTTTPEVIDEEDVATTTPEISNDDDDISTTTNQVIDTNDEEETPETPPETVVEEVTPVVEDTSVVEPIETPDETQEESSSQSTDDSIANSTEPPTDAP